MNADMLALPSAVGNDQSMDRVRALKRVTVKIQVICRLDGQGNTVGYSLAIDDGAGVMVAPATTTLDGSLGILRSLLVDRFQSANAVDWNPVETSEGSAKA